MRTWEAEGKNCDQGDEEHSDNSVVGWQLGKDGGWSAKEQHGNRIQITMYKHIIAHGQPGLYQTK